MLILLIYFLNVFILNINCLFHKIDENLLLDKIANKIINYVNENKIPLILTNKLIGDDAGSMSSTYNGYLNLTNNNIISVIVKYSSFKSIWNYVHKNEIDRLYKYGCYTYLNEYTNEYIISNEDKYRILSENLIPCELYVVYKSYLCPYLMATSTIVNPTYSYFSFFKSIEDNDDNKYFFIIFKKLENSISLKSYLQLYLNKLTMDIVKYLIKSILISIIKLKNMFIIHLDLNSSNIFIMNNDNIHNIRLIDFSIIKFIYKSSSFNVMYSENLHESFQSIFFNCPSCFYSTYSIQTIIFAQPFHQSFKNYTIEQILNQPFLN